MLFEHRKRFVNLASDAVPNNLRPCLTFNMVYFMGLLFYIPRNRDVTPVKFPIFFFQARLACASFALDTLTTYRWQQDVSER